MRFVAIHEAGHAVAQHVKGWELRFVGIGRANVDGEAWGGGSDGSNRAAPEGAVIAYAGPLAEAKSRGIFVSDEDLISGRIPADVPDRGGWDGDADLARQLAGADKTATFAAEARRLIEKNDIWRAISSVAEELCKRVKTTAAREVPDQVRCIILRGVAADRSATYSYLFKEEVAQLIDTAFRS